VRGLQVVAGALVEGDEDDESAADGNAGSWIKVELMLEEVCCAWRRARMCWGGTGSLYGTRGPARCCCQVLVNNVRPAGIRVCACACVRLHTVQYLDGPEVDCDLVLSDGEAVYGAVTDNWPTVEPYFNETGSNCPSILPGACRGGGCSCSRVRAQAAGAHLRVRTRWR
jgi:hypothetical protein